MSEGDGPKPYSGKWMMVFTVEMDLPSQFDEDFGELSEELTGIDLTRELEKLTKNHTWKHVASIPKTKYWLKKKHTDLGIQWETEKLA